MNSASNLTPLVFLPGTLCDEQLFKPQSDFFSSKRQVIVGDVSRSDSLSKIAKDVLDDSPKIFALAGLSMGGIVAMEIMRQAPKRVERLALLNTSYTSEPEDKQVIRREQIDKVNKHGFAGMLKMVEEYYFPFYVAKKHLTNSEIKQTVLQMAERAGLTAFNNQWQALLHRVDSAEALQKISVPTLVLCGDEDALCKPKVHREMAALIKNSHLEIIPDCGHLSTLEKPEVVNQILQQWLISV